MLEPLVQRLGDEIHVAVGDLAHGVDPAAHAEDLVVDAQHCLQVPVLVRDLRGEQQLHVVVGAASRNGASSRATLNSAWKRCAKIQTMPACALSSSAGSCWRSVSRSSARADH